MGFELELHNFRIIIIVTLISIVSGINIDISTLLVAVCGMWVCFTCGINKIMLNLMLNFVA